MTAHRHNRNERSDWSKWSWLYEHMSPDILRHGRPETVEAYLQAISWAPKYLFQGMPIRNPLRWKDEAPSLLDLVWVVHTRVHFQFDSDPANCTVKVDLLSTSDESARAAKPAFEAHNRDRIQLIIPDSIFGDPDAPLNNRVSEGKFVTYSGRLTPAFCTWLPDWYVRTLVRAILVNGYEYVDRVGGPYWDTLNNWVEADEPVLGTGIPRGRWVDNEFGFSASIREIQQADRLFMGRRI